MIGSRPRHLSPRALGLAVADAISLAAAMLLTLTWHLGPEEALVLALSWTPGVVGVIGSLLGLFYLCGLYDDRTLERTEAAVVPSLVAVVFAVLAALGSDDLRSCWPALFVFGAVLFAALVSVRLVHLRAVRAGWLRARAVVVGSPVDAHGIRALLLHHHHPDLEIVGVVRPERRERLAGTGAGEVPVLGTLGSLRELVHRHGVQRVIVAGGLEASPEVSRELRHLRLGGIAVLDYVSLHERVAQEVPLAEVDDAWLFRAAMFTSRFHVKGMKRAVDVVVTALASVPAALLFLLAALAIKLSDHGPVIFRQERLGLNGRPFKLLKLRTMRVDAEKLTGPVWSTDNDPRITRVGRILRKFRLDELPQLWNVLVGDMSLVGPRPERPELARRITEQLPLFSERLAVRPGITGWAQVMAPYAASIQDSAKKLQYDLYYIKNLSLVVDCLVIIKTLKTVIFGREREQGGMVAGRQLQTELGREEPGRLTPPRSRSTSCPAKR